jgi:hypothetical protein
MNYHVIEARYIGGHVVWLKCADGTSGEIDLGRTAPVSHLSSFTTMCE